MDLRRDPNIIKVDRKKEEDRTCYVCEK